MFLRHIQQVLNSTLKIESRSLTTADRSYTSITHGQVFPAPEKPEKPASQPSDTAIRPTFPPTDIASQWPGVDLYIFPFRDIKSFFMRGHLIQPLAHTQDDLIPI